ncbi:MAG: beta-galactosidase [Oryzihumus sp.]
MIEIQRRQILVDGVPRIVMAGEIHYFRVPREEWPQRIALLKEAGCTAVASYIPWLVHELPDGRIDVTGETRPERDVAAFIDLCAQEGLWFIARPGPFIMAELKNEGLPFRLYDEHPEIVPVGWDGKPATTRTVDYLAPAYLAECRRWFDAVLPPIAQRLQPNGGNVIAVQLDNEVGMLAWVSNTPDLTDHLLDDLRRWVREHHGAAVSDRYPVDLDDDAAWAAAVRSPEEKWAGALRLDLGTFMRDRFARYVQALREMAEANGVQGVPFVINIHGTAGGDGAPFPIGISQLVQTYARVPGMLSGSDHYMGDMTLSTTTDLYVLNAFMAAVHDEDQPITSMEFEAGTGDYGGGTEMLYDPATVDLKTRLSLAQGNRLINYYLFAGGINGPLDQPVGDGNDRISFTGERHGTAAPVGPEGQKGLTFEATARAVHAVNALEPWLARMDEEHDAVQLGFVLDSYMTEYHHPDSAVMRDVVEDLSAHRGAGQRKALGRSLLLDGYRFGAVDLQHDDPRPGGVVALAVGRHMAPDVQRRLVAHVEGGGGLLLLGPLPRLDLEGRPCTVLADALGVRPGEVVRESAHTYPSVVTHGWAAPWAETRVGWWQELHPVRGDVVLTDTTGRVCGVDVPLGAGRAVVLSAEVLPSTHLFGRALRRLGAHPGLRVESSVPGVYATTTADTDGHRLVHLLNITGYTPSVRLALDGQDLHDGQDLVLPPRSGFMLPLGLDLPWARIEWANAEIRSAGEDSVAFGPGLGHAGNPTATVVVLRTDREVPETDAYTVERDGGTVRVVSRPGAGPLEVTPA